MENDRYHHENLREQLIERGIALMNEQGYEKFSLRALAGACGVSHAAPYRHFRDKDDLFAAMRKYVVRRVAEKLEKTAEAHRNAPHILTELGKAYVGFFAENPQYHTFLSQRKGMEMRISPQGVESAYEPFEIFYRAARECLDARNIPPTHRAGALTGMWALIHGLASLAATPGIEYEGDWVALTEQVLTGDFG